MPRYYWVLEEYETDETEYEKIIAFCQYESDAKTIQEKHEGSIIKIVNQINTWEWQPI